MMIDQIQHELDKRGIGEPKLISGVHVRVGAGRGGEDVYISGIFLREVDDYIEAIIYSQKSGEKENLKQTLSGIVQKFGYTMKSTPGRYEIRESRVKLKDLISELGFRGYGPSATHQGTERGQGNKYPEAGENSQPEVQKAIKRFRAFPDSERGKTPLLYWLLGDGTPKYKMSKVDSKYQQTPNESQQCGNCEFLYKKIANNNHICSQIDGEVSPEGWCRLWVPGNKND